MSLDDPFFVVRDEVQKAVQTSQNLYERWTELVENPRNASKEEYDWTTNELRNSLRSIEWDLEDLEETVVEKNPKKFKIEQNELLDRREFIQRTKATVQRMNNHLASQKSKPRTENNGVRQSLLSGSGNRSTDRYTKLDHEMELSNQRFIDDTQQQQQSLLSAQDDHLDMIGSSVGVLKNMSHSISNELEEQNIMLDDMGHTMDNTESRLDTTMKKMAKVMHMSNDRRQWCAIFVLLGILLFIIILFIVL